MTDNPSLQKQPRLDQWVEIGTDGRIKIRTGKVDIGQRISTALSLIAAEELDVDLRRIDMVSAETGVAPDEGVTSGSNSMEESGRAIRLATATARAHLLARAAESLGVDGSSLDVTDGLVQSRGTNRSVTYWDLQGGIPFDTDVDLDVTPKTADTYKLVGRRTVARNMEGLVTGAVKFVHDMVLPDMLHARVIRPPHYHARLKSFAPPAVDGIEIVRDGSFVAVAGADEYATLQAATRVANGLDWGVGDGLEEQDIYESLTANERVSLPVVDGMPVKEPVPALADPPGNAAATVAARYDKPYIMHASIAPSAAMALWEDGKLTVWTHSQGIYVLRDSMAEALGLAVENVKLIHGFGAGCYGHNGADDVAVDAALVARALPGKPVLLKWSREDEHAWEPYNSAMAMVLRGSVDADGNILEWSHETYSDTHIMRPRPAAPGAGPARLLAMRHVENSVPAPVPQPMMGHHVGIHRNLDPLYTFPNKRLVKNLVRGLPLRTSAMRTLGAFGNVFALESFMDEMADAAGADPIEFRLRNLADARANDVIAAAAAAFKTPVADGYGRGFGFARYKNVKAYAAVGVELSVTDAVEVNLHRVVVAADAGQVVDPDGLKAQMEGGMLQAASWTLHEQVTFDRTGITSRDWDSYPILRFDNIPETEIILIHRPGEPYLGAGEAVAGPTAAAIGNAIKNATGLRLRRLPLNPDAIRRAALAENG